MHAKFEKIADVLRQELDAGRYPERMPSERELAKRHQTTIVTMRKAQALLIDEGRLFKRQPHGTFVIKKERPRLRVSFYTSLLNADTRQTIEDSFKTAFPETDIELLDRNAPGLDKRGCDLIGIPNLSPVAYQDLAVPFCIDPECLPQYFVRAFDVHRIRGLYYGLPVVFSPTVLIGIKQQLDAVGLGENPYGMDLDALNRLAAEARRRGLRLWNRETALKILRSIVFSASVQPGVLHSLDPAAFQTVLMQWMPLFAPDFTLDTYANLGMDPRVMILWACRQSLYAFDPAQHRVLAWPRELRECTGVAGEFLLLNRFGTHRDLAIRVAWHFLTPQIQSLLGRNGLGVPVLKAAAMDCLGTTPWREDLFLTEGSHICANSARENEFLHRLETLGDKLLAGDLSTAAFVGAIGDEIAHARERHERLEAFMTHPQTEPADTPPAFG